MIGKDKTDYAYENEFTRFLKKNVPYEYKIIGIKIM